MKDCELACFEKIRHAWGNDCLSGLFNELVSRVLQTSLCVAFLIFFAPLRKAVAAHPLGETLPVDEGVQVCVVQVSNKSWASRPLSTK